MRANIVECTHNAVITTNSDNALVKQLKGKVIAIIGNIGQMANQLPSR
jgi:hypothetical protein